MIGLRLIFKNTLEKNGIVRFGLAQYGPVAPVK